MDGAGEVLGSGGGEERDEFGDVLRRADPAQGDVELAGELSSGGVNVGAVLLGQDLQPGGQARE